MDSLKLKMKTCAKHSKKLLVLCGSLQNFQNNSRETVDQNCTTIKYEVLTKHCNNSPSLQRQKKVYNFNMKKILKRPPQRALISLLPYKISLQTFLHVQSNEI